MSIQIVVVDFSSVKFIMSDPTHKYQFNKIIPYSHTTCAGLVLALAFLVIVFRSIISDRSFDSLGLSAILDALFTICLSTIVLVLASAIGLFTLHKIGIDEASSFEKIIFAIPIGLGSIAIGILVLALIQILTPSTIFLWLVILSACFWRWIIKVLNEVCIAFKFRWFISNQSTIDKKIMVCFGGIILLMTFIQALTPVWDADGLIYHLYIPRLWLKHGGLVPLTPWEANYPLTVELLYSIGIAFGSDSFAKVIHLTFAVILVAGTYGFARQSSRAGFAWVPPLLLIGIPIVPLWASTSYSDMGWAAFEFLSLFALIEWYRSGNRKYIVLGGLLIGWGIGSKYPALTSFGIYGLWVLWQSRKAGIKQIILNGATFGLSAALVGGAWYLKNWICFSNPVYPLPIGDILPGGGKQDLWMAYMWDGFGTGGKLQDYLLIPWNLFAHRERFSTFAGNIEIPNPLFLLTCLFPFVKKTPVMRNLAILTLLRYLAWMIGVQQTRLLLPIFPGLSILTGEVLSDLATRRIAARTGRAIVAGLVGGMLTVTLIYAVLLLQKTKPLGVLTGRESKSQFLNRLVENYPATQFIQKNFPTNARVMMMWDGRGYYCDDRCLPDSDHTQWTELIGEQPDITTVMHELSEEKVTHLMLSRPDTDFILQHDPTDRHHLAIQFFLDVFRPACTRAVYQDEWVSVYKLTCSPRY